MPIASLSDEDQRYLKNVASVKNPFREWTRSYADQDNIARTETFRGALVAVTGFDSPLSGRQVVLIREDSGQKKGYPVSEFDAAGRAYADANTSEWPGAVAADRGDYVVKPDQYDPSNPSAAPEPFNYHATSHFVFYWGNHIEDAAKNWSDPKFREMNFAYFEKVWAFYQGLNASLPYYNAAKKYKTNIYITGTGLSAYPGGFAFGGERVLIHPGAMLEGSSVIPHEFGHTVQLYSGGYRGPLNNVGWFWECDANWDAGNFVPGVALALDVYAQRMNYELDSSRDNYGSWPFLQYIAEHPKFSRKFPFKVWENATRDAQGNATETAFETIQRLGASAGVFKGNGVGGFGDIIGEMAAHNADWDYVYGDGYAKAVTFSRTNGTPFRGRTYLQPVADRPGWYRPFNSQSPKQYGVNIVDLIPSPNATKVSADLSGIIDPAIGSDWRAMFVVTDRDGAQRYSREWRNGVGNMALEPGDTHLAIALTGAPDLYTRQQFRPGYNVKRHFPYEIAFTGCVPSIVPVGVRHHDGISGSPAPNGGGFVAASAHVDPTAYVGPDAQVLDYARVLGNAHIEDHATVMEDATVSGSAVIGNWAVVRERATVTENARVRDYAVIRDNATIRGDARALEFINVEGNGEIGGEALAKGFGDLYTGADCPVGGGTIMGQDSEIYFNMKSPVMYGTLYGYMNSDQLKDPSQVVDNNFLSLHYDFAERRGQILQDVLTDNDAVLRGHPVYKEDGLRPALNLDGQRQYATLEGGVLDTSGATIDMRLKWNGGRADQTVFSFHGAGGSLIFTPKAQDGNAEIILSNQGKTETVHCSRAIPANALVRVTVIIMPGSAKVYLNGDVIGASSPLQNTLDSLHADAGYLGCSPDLSHFFDGELYDFAIYRHAFPAFASFTPPYKSLLNP